MNFLEAHGIVTKFQGGEPIRFRLATSGTADKLDIFLKAAGAVRGLRVDVRTLPFNTLRQTIASTSEPKTEGREVFLLVPWDFVPEADWRTGLPTVPANLAAVQNAAEETASRLAARRQACFAYISAPLPPIFSDPATTRYLEAWLSALAARIGSQLLPGEVFSLASYLSSGGALASGSLGTVAEAVIDLAVDNRRPPGKVLVTDLDNVMWRGVVGEDGVEGIQYSPEGAGFKHFLYQTFLTKLKNEGTLLAAVSRNDIDLALGPFRTERMSLRNEDFVAIVASYNAKSAQIRQIAKRLNLGLDSFVFVDDNPIELEEVGAAIPEIRTVRFPDNDNNFPEFLNEIASLFRQSVVTAEDAARTELYRRRLEGMAPADTEGADLTMFLRGLAMSLSIHDRSTGDRTRAVQLINKTNQFNLNGLRFSDEEVGAVLADGGRLFTCTLSDRTGTHGEILCCLIDGRGMVRSFVMSCRVFQRRVEYAFFVWLNRQSGGLRGLHFTPTPRNEPIQQFLADAAFDRTDNGIVRVGSEDFIRRHATDLELFALSTPI